MTVNARPLPQSGFGSFQRPADNQPRYTTVIVEWQGPHSPDPAELLDIIAQNAAAESALTIVARESTSEEADWLNREAEGVDEDSLATELATASGVYLSLHQGDAENPVVILSQI